MQYYAAFRYKTLSKIATAQAEDSVCCLVRGVKIGDKRCRGISVVCGVRIHLRNPTIGEWMSKFLTTGSLLQRKVPWIPSVWIMYGKPTYAALMKSIHQSPRELWQHKQGTSDAVLSAQTFTALAHSVKTA